MGKRDGCYIFVKRSDATPALPKRGGLISGLFKRAECALPDVPSPVIRANSVDQARQVIDLLKAEKSVSPFHPDLIAVPTESLSAADQLRCETQIMKHADEGATIPESLEATRLMYRLALRHLKRLNESS